MGKDDKRTEDKLKKLSKSLGEFTGLEEKKAVRLKKNSSNFTTTEVIILLFLTTIISLIMGSLTTYKIINNKGRKIDKELQSFIQNYEYIKNNYYDKIDKTKLIDSAIAGMLASLDKNSSYVGSSDSNFSVFLEGSYKGVGLQVFKDENGNIVIYNVIENSSASKAGIESGDIIIKVGGKSVDGKGVEEVSKMIKTQEDEFSIVVKRKGEEKEFNLKVSNITLNSVFSDIFERDNKKIGYINLTIFANNSYEQFKKHLEKIEEEDIYGLILDLRDNNGGHLSTAEDIISLFLDSSHPIYQIKSKNGKSKYYSKGKSDKKYKIVILVNGESASASEVTTAALKEQYNATVIGEKTYGKGTVQELQTLPDGGQYKLTTKRWLTSKGKEIDGVGLEPDIHIEMDEKFISDPSKENDNQLQKAIETIIK